MFFTISKVELSERDNKETLVVKEEETYDVEVFEEVEAEVARLLNGEGNHGKFVMAIYQCL